MPPKLNMQVSLMGVGVSGTSTQCLGTVKLRINVSKGLGTTGVTREVTPTLVTGKFSTVTKAGDGYQVYQVSDFELGNTFTASDKIYINIKGANDSGNLKLLATFYGKDNQISGFTSQDDSLISVSDLGTTLILYNYPILNGDIGSDTSINQGDGVISGNDFIHMKNQWNSMVSGPNGRLRADLNGDCIVNSMDLQIYKNSTKEQYGTKTF